MSEYSPPQVNRKLEVNLWWITAVLIAMNVGLYGWQVLSGVDATSPTTADAIRWGADFSPLTFLEQPQRLFTSMFFHFGLVHLMLNMWALYIFGSIAEQMLGRFYFIGLYLLAGLMGSLLSSYITIRDSYALLEHFDPTLLPHVGAGASGAVMGLGAALTDICRAPALLAMIWYISQKIHQANLGAVVGLIIGAVLCALFYQYCVSLIPPIEPLWQEILAQMKSQLGL